MKRLYALAIAALLAMGLAPVAPKTAEAGVRVGVFIGTGYGYGHRRYYRPRYYRPYRVYRPRRYYRPRYRVRRIYRAPRRVHRRGFSAAHYGYCSSRYRSYRASDNTFQPYHGRRRQCRSRY